MSTSTRGPEYGALASTRRTLVSVASGIVCAFALLSLLRAWPDVTTAERAVGVAGCLIVAVGIALSRRVLGLWLVLLGLATVVAAAIVPSGSEPWIPVTVLMAYVVYFSVFLTSRSVGLIIALSGAVVLAVLWASRPPNVIPGPLGVLAGWGAVAALLISGLAAWLAWNLLVAEARAADARLADLQAQTAASLAIQERARAWRSAATRVHESVLNTIRYVLTAPEPDRARLTHEASSAVDIEGTVPDGVPTVGSLVTAVQAAAAVDDLAVDVTVPDVALEPAVWEAVRGAVVELVRNAARHSRGTRIQLTAGTAVAGNLKITVADDGVGMPAGSRPGVGTQHVLAAALEEVGARLLVRTGPRGGTVATVIIPRVRPASERRTQARAYPPFDKGRLLVTAPVAGICLAGIAYFVMIAFHTAPGSLAAAVSGLLGITFAVTIVLKRSRVSAWIAVVLVVIPGLVPWFLLEGAATCQQAAILAPVINVAGYCIMVVTAWSRWWPGLVGLALWGSGSILAVTQLPPTCRQSTLLAVGNSLVALPIILAVASAGARAYQRAQDRTQLTRSREIMERSRALAAVDINESLQGAVDEALVIVRAVADGAPFDDEMRRDLERIDGRIRAGIQVDPQSSGAMSVLAKSTIDEVSALGVTVNVRALVSSTDQRALPLLVQHLVYRLLAAPGPTATVQAFSDGEEDHLSLAVGRHALTEAGVRPGDTLHFDDVVVEVDDEGPPVDDGAECTILVSRPIGTDVPSTATSSVRRQ